KSSTDIASISALVIPEAANASLSGAKTVNVPSVASVSAKPAFTTAAFNILKFGLFTTISVIVDVAGSCGFGLLSSSLQATNENKATLTIVMLARGLKNLFK